MSSSKNMCITKTIYFKSPFSFFKGVKWKLLENFQV